MEEEYFFIMNGEVEGIYGTRDELLEALQQYNVDSEDSYVVKGYRINLNVTRHVTLIEDTLSSPLKEQRDALREVGNDE
jgi:hypothetical protein